MAYQKTFAIRFFFSASTNLIRGALNFVTGLLIARWLGPSEFGVLAFLLATFLALRQLVDPGVSSAFFTMLSERQKPILFVLYFFGWLGFQLIMATIILLFVLPDTFIAKVWLGEDRWMIVIAALAVFAQHVFWPVAQQLCESSRLTFSSQTIAVSVSVVNLLAIFLLWHFHQLSMLAVLLVTIMEFFVATAVAFFIYFKFFQKQLKPKPVEVRPMLREYLAYCVPIIPYATLSFAYEFWDRWLLKKYGGDEQQGIFQAAIFISSVTLIVTTSILRIYWKEASTLFVENRMDDLGAMHQRVCRGIFAFCCFVSITALFWIPEIINITVGKNYQIGWLTFGLMILFSIQQSISQILSSLLYATRKTKTLSIIGVVTLLFSMVFSTLILVPSNVLHFGLGLGSEGLAIKMLGLQFINVVVTMIVISRIFCWKNDFLAHVKLFCFFVVCAYSVKVLVSYLNTGPDFVQLVTSFVLMTFVTVTTVKFRPRLFGLDKINWRVFLSK